MRRLSSRAEPALRGPRVELRALVPADWLAWREVRVACKEWLERWEPRAEPGAPDPVASAEAFRSRCGAWDRQRHFDTAYGYGIFLREGPLVGEVSLGSLQRGAYQSAFVGYWIDQRRAGNAYVPEAVTLVLRYAFEALRLHRVEAAIVPRNDRSRRVAAKLGLRDEGTSVGFLQIQGVWEDHIRYAMTAEEWHTRGHELVERYL